MGRPALLLLLLAAAAPCTVLAGQGASQPRSKSSARARPTPPARPALAEAKAALAALQRDRARRRFRHHWERAIGNILAAARGRDAGAAYLEAARARYALYRWSANEADREKALVNADRAARRGVREAAALARAIRREAGEDRPPPLRGRRAKPHGPEPAEEDPAPDPELEAAVAALSEGRPARALPLGAPEGASPARVTRIRTWSSGDYTRVAVYLSHWVGWHRLELPATPGTPRRLALDFRPAALAGSAMTRSVEGVQVDRVRAAQNDAETVRVVLDLPGDDRVDLFALADPPRLVVDVGAHRGPPRVASQHGEAEGGNRTAAAIAASGARGSGTAPPASADAAAAPTAAAEGPSEAREGAAAPATAARHAAAPPLAPGAEVPAGAEGAARGGGSAAASLASYEGPRLGDEAPGAPGGVKRVVIDAGHGGHDPGAIGPRGVREKDVTLAIARRLARRLGSQGFEVVLTRSDDRYLALEERTAIANTARGDLFVSIHANAHPRRNRVGVETYFLNVADDRYAARLAARENGLDLAEGEVEVARILSDLDAKASAGASRRLAALVQREVIAGVRARVGDVRDLGVKSALFYVLLGARMPAVLVETAFISNHEEERRLASRRYQDEVAAGIARAVVRYARSEARVAAR